MYTSIPKDTSGSGHCCVALDVGEPYRCESALALRPPDPPNQRLPEDKPFATLGTAPEAELKWRFFFLRVSSVETSPAISLNEMFGCYDASWNRWLSGRSKP